MRLTRASALRAVAASVAVPLTRVAADAAPSASAVVTTPAAAHAELVAGNDRYARDAAIHCNRNYDRRAETLMGQSPFAIVLGCSDSRVPPEVIFDQRLGELFVIRLAGNVADDNALGSIEYAVLHFSPRLLLVLGHEHCGAVSAALEELKSQREPTGFIGSVVKPILPAARRAQKQAEAGKALHDAVRENVRDVVAHVRDQSTVVARTEREGALRLSGATYDLGDGRVTFL